MERQIVGICVALFLRHNSELMRCIAGPWAVRIACGATADTHGANGFLWSKDRDYSGGSAASVALNNHKAPQLNTLRYFSVSDGGENCYNITVPVGHYLIRYLWLCYTLS